ncbi:hypothetical protein [Streptomyces cinnamoneus]|uniref:hypothetical protein n=1 Tax=Streptomyces cinnamoneus TaxID=53446 RepID=UPI0030B88F74
MDPLVPPRNAGPLTKLVETLLAKDPALRPPAELVEQILREPAAEPATASMRPPAASRAASRPPDRPRPRRAGPARRPAPPPPCPPPPPRPHPPPRPRPPPRRPPRRGLRPSGAGPAGSPPPRPSSRWCSPPAPTSCRRTAAQTRKRTPRRRAPPPPLPQQRRPGPAPVPKGYHLVEEKKVGVSFPVPDGWRREKIEENDSIVYVDPSGLVGLRVSVLDLASTDPLQHWKDDEAKSQAEGKLPGYRQLRMQSTTYRGRPAAIWEFTFKGRARDFRAADLGFGRPGEKEYAIYLSAPRPNGTGTRRSSTTSGTASGCPRTADLGIGEPSGTTLMPTPRGHVTICT